MHNTFQRKFSTTVGSTRDKANSPASSDIFNKARQGKNEMNIDFIIYIEKQETNPLNKPIDIFESKSN